MPGYKIFTFWEPKNQLIPYLEVCRKTWQYHLPKHEIITIDYSNMDEYLAGDVYDFSILKRLPLPMQKDAIMVAVVNAHGGIFMDIDTIILRDIAPILNISYKSEAVMFGSHCAFLLSKANSKISSSWLRNIQERLAKLRHSENYDPAWNYLGNSALNQAKEEIINSTNKGISFAGLFRKIENTTPETRFLEKFMLLRQRMFFSTMYKKYLFSLDRKKTRYIMEAVYETSKKVSPMEKYQNFWFSEKRDIGEIISANPVLVGLHNSWTPDWYKALTAQAVLKHNSLLSKTLNYALKPTMLNGESALDF